MRGKIRGNPAALMASFLLMLFPAIGFAATPEPDEPPATRIVDAADHAELDAGIAVGGVVRVALLDDRITRVIQAPDGSAVEHDPDEGDIYIRLPGDSAVAAAPFALFVGSEKGFTYRLTLTPLLGGSAQILIRNPATSRDSGISAGAEGDARIADIAALIRAVAIREPLPGFFRVDQGEEWTLEEGGAVLEVWRGMDREAWLLALNEADASVNAQALAVGFGPGTLAVWLDDAEESGVRLAVIVREGVDDVR